jgi:cyclic pyranopterin monophosphate synthase
MPGLSHDPATVALEQLGAVERFAPRETSGIPAPTLCPVFRKTPTLSGVFSFSDRMISGSPVIPHPGTLSMPGELTHFDEHGGSRMVDVSDKPPTRRLARASARLRMSADTLRLIRDRRVAKGDVLEVARLAGLMAAKRTGELIPLCHPLSLESVAIAFEFPAEDVLRIEAQVQVTARTGVEMEALVAASVAALTVYDMCKAVDRGMVIECLQLEEKSGGRSGDFRRSAGEPRMATP